ncbi:transcriptional regulator CynR [Hypericibacter terrae]|uniref:Transcriptional regulator CynR n=1 Tax=Hypericibacter terrae TaxID=2602015 RepID=A0A5J6MW85_9PROT|nr:LysR family transcriptional regulator [Hypericibacter terrae]QEX19096.1 transcriptional regulator CynR [Hypericibacter terrae]
MFHLSHLRYFYAVAQTRSIRKAAESLHVAQSAVSRQIKNLEEELGVSLFDRHPRGVRLTDAGQILAKYAQQTMLNLDRIRSEIDDLRALRRGTIKICTVEAGIIDILPQVIRDFRLRYPSVSVTVLVRGSQGVVDTILNDDADLGLAFNAPYHPDIELVATQPQRLYAAVGPHHPIAGKKQVRLAELKGYPIALPDSSFGIRQLVDQIQRSSQIRIEPVLTTDSIQMLVSFARLDLGVAFLPFFAIKGEIAGGRVAGVPLADPPARNVNAEIVVHKGRQLPIPAEEFLEVLKKALRLLK